MHKIYPQSSPHWGSPSTQCCGYFDEMRFIEAIRPRLGITLLFIFSNISHARSLSCSDILALPEDHKISLNELKIIHPKEIVECLPHLSKEPLDTPEANYIWKTIVDLFGGVQNIPDRVLITLHYVTVAIKPEEFANITLSSIDVVKNFGLDYNLGREQLAVIADRVREDFAGKEPEDYTFYDLVALRKILCQFNRSEIVRIHPSAFREAAPTLGKLKTCGREALAGFATLAVQPSAFGPTATWTNDVIKKLGIIADAVPMKKIHRNNTVTEKGSDV